MNWSKVKEGFVDFLRIEKSLSQNSISAYLSDITKLTNYLNDECGGVPVKKVKSDHMKDFLQYLNENNISPRTQARTLSGIKALFKYLMLEEVVEVDPTALLELPKVGRQLPEILTVDEVDAIINAVETDKAEGERNIAMLETLYSCGLRVSELINLKLTDLFFEQGFIKVAGKGDKDRLVPVSDTCKKVISEYVNNSRKLVKIKPQYKNFLFLNRRGAPLSRVMIFTIVKNLSNKIGLKKKISPHTFRHSFATHLVMGGADLRAVQEMLGHESILTTEIYAHLDKKYLQEIVTEFHPRS